MNSENDNNLVREIRKEFFAYRNGIVADKLRKAGDPHSLIMGCLLVDIQAITQRQRETVNDVEALKKLAQELWNDTNCRECRLAAPMLYPPEEMNMELAQQWCQTIETAEVADNLCHKLLRKTPIAEDMLQTLIANKRPLTRYTGYRLLLNLLLMGKVTPSAQLQALIGEETDEQLFGQLLNAINEEWEDRP